MSTSKLLSMRVSDATQAAFEAIVNDPAFKGLTKDDVLANILRGYKMQATAAQTPILAAAASAVRDMGERVANILLASSDAIKLAEERAATEAANHAKETKTEIESLKETVKSLRETDDRHRKQASTAESKLTDITVSRNTLIERVAEQAALIEAYQKQIETMQHTINSMKTQSDEIQSLKKQVEELTTHTANLTKANDELSMEAKNIAVTAEKTTVAHQQEVLELNKIHFEATGKYETLLRDMRDQVTSLTLQIGGSPAPVLRVVEP